MSEPRANPSRDRKGAGHPISDRQGAVIENKIGFQAEKPMQNPDAAPFKTTGWVVSGVGRGAEFLSLEWVRKELRRELCLIPYPGTLNLRVPPEVRNALFARRHSFLRIADPSSPDCPGYLERVILRANGGVCPSAYLILPELTMYKDVLEVISAYNLRQKLNLKDGDAVDVEEFSIR